MNLNTTYLGLTLQNPIIVGSSGLTENIETIVELERNQAAAIVLKSIFEEEIVAEVQTNMQQMQSHGFIYPETFDYYEQTSQDPEITDKYLELIKDAKRAVKIPVIASINCLTAEEWTSFPKQIEQAGADALELNVFILPAEFNRTAAQIEEVYFKIIETVKSSVKIPVSLKIGSYFTDLGSMIQRLSQSGIQGLVLFNRFYNTDIDIERLEVVSGNVLSNPADLSLPLRWMAIMSGRVQCDLAASGGIHSSKAMIKQLLAGATATQIVSVIYENGPEIIKMLLSDLRNWMTLNGFDTIDQFRGKMNHAKNHNPAAFERVQFMRYFRNYKY